MSDSKTTVLDEIDTNEAVEAGIKAASQIVSKLPKAFGLRERIIAETAARAALAKWQERT